MLDELPRAGLGKRIAERRIARLQPGGTTRSSGGAVAGNQPSAASVRPRRAELSPGRDQNWWKTPTGRRDSSAYYLFPHECKFAFVVTHSVLTLNNICFSSITTFSLELSKVSWR